MTKILMFSGSSRKESVNQKLIIATAKLAKQQGAEVTVINLKDYPMPIYDGDIEEQQGYPESAQKLYDLIESHDALVIASPEYNSLPSALLKNTIDWVSRIDVKIYSGKTAAILSASPGALGGLRGLPHLRTLLTNLNILVIPKQLALGGAFQAFNQEGDLSDANQTTTLSSVMEQLISVKHS